MSKIIKITAQFAKDVDKASEKLRSLDTNDASDLSPQELLFIWGDITAAVSELYKELENLSDMLTEIVEEEDAILESKQIKHYLSLDSTEVIPQIRPSKQKESAVIEVPSQIELPD